MNLPVLHQSMVETAACPRCYVEIYIKGNRQPSSVASVRGTEIHEVMAHYVRHCAQNQVGADWAYFNQLARSVGPVAGPILDNLRDSYEVPYKYVYGTEVLLMLDERFNPTRHIVHSDQSESWHQAEMPGVVYSDDPAAHAGTLDVILIDEDLTAAKINDYKSHPSPFEADTYQSCLYSFMLFKHIPTLTRVTFELNFVRYKNALRSVVWKREEMPAMQAQIERARERQRVTHADPDAAPALPCTSCTYCPLAKSLTCPIADWNEHTAVDDVQRLISLEFYRRMSELHRPILKAHVAVSGPIRYQDGNGVTYTAQIDDVAETRYPADRTAIQVLDRWKAATGEDLLDGRLNFSSTKLKAALKAKKRAPLQEMFEESVIETGTKPKFAVFSSRGETFTEFNPYQDEE